MTQSHCPTCGTPVDEEAGHGLCPGCLLKEGLKSALPVEAGGRHPLGSALQEAVGGQYRVERLLGRGAMGAVFLAREKALDREVAIKVLPPEGAEDGDRERFRREARIAARLTHPHIVPLHSFGETAGVLYFVMGYVRGEPLGARMRRGVSVISARRILTELADALDHAHRQGVVHRDVKPDNVLIDDESGRALLTDFGIARRDAHTGLTATGSVVGTPHYMSPEQAAGRTEIDGRSDIYSLGVMAYAMLAGRLPFDGPTVGDVLVQHISKEPPPLRSVAPGVPDALAAVVARCLAKDPRDRWPDARAFKEALAATAVTDDLPEPLREIEGAGLLLLLAMAVAASIELAQWLWNGALRNVLPPQGLAVGVWTLVGVLLCLKQALPVRRAGFGWRRILWAAFLEPSWWPFWYPRGLRRPEEDGVWDRLPARLRAQRWVRLATPLAWLTGALIAIAFVSPRFHQFRDWPALAEVLLWPPVRGGVRPFPPLIMFGCMLGWTLVGVAHFAFARLNDRWLARFGLPEHDRRAILYGALSRRALWKREAVAAVLRPAPADEPAAARTPAEMAHRIASAAEAFSGVEGEVARDAAAAARQLLASIREADCEIARLAADTDPQEAERLRARLAGLPPPAAGEPDQRTRMRALFEQQLGLLEELQDRLDQAAERRERRVELLKSLWLEIANLRAAATQVADGQTSARVQALCARIASAHTATSQALPNEDSPTLAR